MKDIEILIKCKYINNWLKESGTPAEDSNIVLAIFNPEREKLATYRGYKVARGLEENLRSIICLKNRFGQSDLAIPTAFYGRCGIWSELPKPEEINDYEKYKSPSRDNDIVIDKIEEKDDTLENFTFIM